MTIGLDRSLLFATIHYLIGTVSDIFNLSCSCSQSVPRMSSDEYV